MTQGQGTSVEGWQKLASGGDRELPLFSIGIGVYPTIQPKVVGYFYVSVFVNSIDPETITERGLIYVPGVVKTLPDINATSLAKFSMWVNWNVPGLDWTLFF